MSVKCAKKSKRSLCDLSGPLCVSVVRVIRRDFTTEAQRTTEVARRKTFDPAQPARVCAQKSGLPVSQEAADYVTHSISNLRFQISNSRFQRQDQDEIYSSSRISIPRS